LTDTDIDDMANIAQLALLYRCRLFINILVKE
jgi:hypothetical protein